MINRLKALVLGLFSAYWIIVVGILVAARPIFDQLLGQSLKLSGDPRPVELRVVAVFTALLMLLSVGVLRGWRWTFWMILVVFLAGILRLPTAALELVGRIPSQGPVWFVVFTAVVGLTQFGIGLAMIRGYVRAGLWAEH